MDIVHCLDDRYVPFCGTAIESLCQNNVDNAVRYHIVSTSLDEENKLSLREIVEKHGKSITFYDIDESILKDCVVRKNDHVSLAAYLRILIPQILPCDVHKALYLDCDLVVCGNLSGLLSEDIDGYACGAVLDGATDDVRTYNRLKYGSDKGYFNTGVLLYNLDYWRENNITETIFSFIAEYPERLLFWDQDAINSVLVEKIRQLPFRYNMTDPFYMRNTPLRQKYLNEINACLSDPTILHFATASKPWLSKNQPHPLKDEFYKYLAMTKWSNDFPFKKPLSLKRRFMNFIEYSLGIRIERVKPSDYLTKNEVCVANVLISSDIQMGGGGNLIHKDLMVI